jgi:hypothetical protein
VQLLDAVLSNLLIPVIESILEDIASQEAKVKLGLQILREELDNFVNGHPRFNLHR